MKKKAVVIHSGGMDSSICLRLAIEEFGPSEVLSLSFDYQQRHREEVKRAATISHSWQVDHMLIHLDFIKQLTRNALTNHEMPIEHLDDNKPNTLVVGRNGLMARLGAIQAHSLGANCIFMGVIGLVESNSGYRDCSKEYMSLMQTILRIDLANEQFEIRAPLIDRSKKDSFLIADQLGVLDYLLKTTITCYEGIDLEGCKLCPACVLRNRGIEEYKANRKA